LGKRPCFGDLAQLAVVGFDGVVGVNQPPDFGWNLEEGRQILPMGFLGSHGEWVFVVPFLTELQKCSFGLLAGGGLILILVRYQPQK